MKTTKDAPVGAATIFPTRRESLVSMDAHRSALVMLSSVDARLRKLVASKSASRNVGG